MSDGGLLLRLELRCCAAPERLDLAQPFCGSSEPGATLDFIVFEKETNLTVPAGGLVDAGSTKWMRHFGCNPEAHLNNNDSYRALASSGDLLLTGPTGTNVADLQILLMR